MLKRKGAELSKLFRISGYLEQDGGWPEAGPSLVGEVIMGELPIFWGCCEELVDGDTLEAGATSYLVGGFLENRALEFYFYKMHDNPPQDMLLCMVPKLKEGVGMWSTPEKSGGGFVDRHAARIKVEELPYSKALEQKISHNFRTGCPELAEFPEGLAEAAKNRKK